MKITTAEIEQAKTERGGWTKETLAKWGVEWPPPKGWKKALIHKAKPAALGSDGVQNP